MIYERDITKTVDFLVGYVYKGLEKEVAKALCIDKSETFPISYEISIPWTWCLNRCSLSQDMWEYKVRGVLFDIGGKVVKELCRTFPTSRLEGSVFVTRSTKGWRSDINFVVKQEPKPVEMTIEEIEAKLGYKIKIVGEK